MEGDTTDMDEDEQMLMEEVIEADVDYEEILADLHNRSANEGKWFTGFNNQSSIKGQQCGR